MPQKRETAYSDVKSFPTGGGAVTFDLLFLQRLKNKFRYAKLVSLLLRTKWVVNTGSAGARGPSLYNIMPRIEFKDSAGPRTLCSGHALMLKNEEEIAGYRNPRDMAASQTTANSQTHHLDLHPVELQSETHEDDHGILLADIGDTGSVTLSLNDPTSALFTNQATIQLGTTFQLVAEVEECEPGLQFPRTVIMDYPITVSPIAARFNVKGSLRSAFVTAGPGAEDSGTALAEMNWMVPDLQYGQGLPSSYLQAKYERRGRAKTRDQAGVIATDDHFVRGQAVPLWVANFGQKIGDMPDLDTLGIQNDGTVPTSPPALVVITSIVDRPLSLVAQSLAARGERAPSEQQVSAAYKAGGVINGTSTAAAKVGRLARRLPVRIKQ